MRNIRAILCSIAITSLLFCGCTRNVKDKEINVSVNGKKLTGSYTGQLSKGVPEGNGQFVSKTKNRTFNYNGEWKNGKLAGNGKLTDTKYVAHFPDVEHTGKYTGDTADGKPNGAGEFTAVATFNDEDLKYTYKGEWKDGIFNGQGVQKFDDKDICTRTGTFKNGKFTPSKYELIESLGDCDSMRFSPSEHSENFIKSHEEFFPANDSIDLSEYIDTTLSYKNLIKSPDKYGDKLINLSNYKISQIFENEMWGYTSTCFLAYSSEYDDYVYVVYLGELPNIYEGSVVTIEGLPISNSSFENVGGGTTLCYIIYGCKIK